MPTRRFVTLAAVAVLATVVAACGDDSTTSGAATPSVGASSSSMDHSSGASPSGAPSQGPPTAGATGAAAGQPGDIMFAQMMIPHHKQAVDMADMALQRSDTSPEMRKLATQIKAAQAPEIEKMTGWLKAWNVPAPTSGDMGDMSGMDHSAHGGMAGMMSEEDMTKLDSADAKSFNRMWLTMMIQHHKGALTMSERVLQTTKNADVSKLATSIVTSQKAEIATMQKML